MVLLASEYDKSKYLKAEDVPREKKFRIKSVTVEELTAKSGSKEKKLVVWLTNDPRGLVLNKTNLRCLKSAFGDDTAAWSQKIIVIFSMMTNIGEMGLRVRIPPPKQAAATANPSPQPAGPSPSSGNGSAAAKPVETAKLVETVKPVEAAPPAKPPAAPVVPVDPELEPDPVPSIGEELDDEIPFE
jgi:hypothetical protein